MQRRRVLLVQLPIPPVAGTPARGNVPLAAGYLALYARRQGLGEAFELDILPGRWADQCGDQGILRAVLDRRPWLVGFSCYLWNIERVLWLAQGVKQADPQLQVALGGPEITEDNAWVLEHPAVDYAVMGEGEQTFAELLGQLHRGGAPRAGRGEGTIPGLWSRTSPAVPPRRGVLATLDEVSSPYLAGILEPGPERLMMLETMRGCRFRCKFCYYPKAYDRLYYLSPEQVQAHLEYARQQNVEEIVLLDPTLNQRPDFERFVRLLAEGNKDRTFRFFGELRAEGLRPSTAEWLRRANFTEVEVGLQSLDPEVESLMGRHTHRQAFEEGTRALLDAGIAVRLDLILGLPGQTADSFRRTLEYVLRSRLFTCVQVFYLSVLPGTEFRQQAERLGLRYQARPPYYVLHTPNMRLEEMYALMAEAQEALGVEFDPAGPWLEGRGLLGPAEVAASASASERASPAWYATVDLDRPPSALPPAADRAVAFSLHLRSLDFDGQRHEAARLVKQLVEENPHGTLEVVLEAAANPRSVTPRTLSALQAACFCCTNYLDRFYSLHPNGLLLGKRLVVRARADQRDSLGPEWIDQVGQYAAILWDGRVAPDALAPHEHTWPLDPGHRATPNPTCLDP